MRAASCPREGLQMRTRGVPRVRPTDGHHDGAFVSVRRVFRGHSSLAGLDAAARCPACGAPVDWHVDSVDCTACGAQYGLVDGIPILVPTRVDAHKREQAAYFDHVDA